MFQGRLITIGLRQHPSEALQVFRAKTKNGSVQTVHLNSDAVAAIEFLRRPRQNPSDSVFPREGSKSSFDTRSWFHPSMEESDIDHYVWHCNRHTFCSWLAMAGASIKEIQETAGHKSITMSARYNHLSPEHKLSVVERTASGSRPVSRLYDRIAARP